MVCVYGMMIVATVGVAVDAMLVVAAVDGEKGIEHIVEVSARLDSSKAVSA